MTKYNWLAALLARSLAIHYPTRKQEPLMVNSILISLCKSRFLKAVNAAPPAGGGKDDKKGDKKDDKNKSADKNVKPGDKKANDKTVDNKTDSSMAKMTPKERRKAKKALRKKKREERRKLREQKRNTPLEVGGAVRFVGGLVTSVKRVSVQYTEDFGTTLPGYMDSTRVLGSN
jgi:hypothetical protein